MKNDRRTFIKTLAAASAAIPFAGTEAFAAEPVQAGKSRFPIAFFSKPLDAREPDFIAETLAKAGLDGLDLTVRPKGRVEPSRVETDLPKMVDAFSKHNLKTDMMVTVVQDPGDEESIRVIRTAGKLGVRHYRLNWYDFDLTKGVWETLPILREKLIGLAELNKSAGIQGGYQNHSGTKVGGAVWDVWELLRGLPVEWISSQYDIRHAVAEGAFSWPHGLRLLHKNIGSLAIKDFTWEIVNRKPKIVNVPLGEGIVDFDQYFKLLKELNVVAPITLHIEYPLLETGEEKLTLLQQQERMVPRIRKDVTFIHNYLAKYQLA